MESSTIEQFEERLAKLTALREAEEHPTKWLDLNSQVMALRIKIIHLKGEPFVASYGKSDYIV